MRADLHMHTIHSDGDLSVVQLIKKAIDKKLEYIAITDHDTFKGFHEALSYEQQHIKIIPGIELSTSYHGESVHVLGYFKTINTVDTPLQKVMDEQKVIRDARAYQMIKLIKEHFNIDIDPSEIFNQTSSIITRGHIARVILKKYPHYTNEELFKTVLSNDSKAYIASTKISTKEGIDLLKKSGALVIIAHPGLYRKLTFDALFELGADGIEVGYKSHQNAYRIQLKKQLEEAHMLYTAGSDFHGEITKNHGDIGDEYLEDDALNQFLTALNKQ